MKEPAIHPDLDASWALIKERVAADSELKAAVVLVLAYEAARLEKRPRLDVHPGAEYARICQIDGQEEGLGVASLALTDTKYIQEQRGLLSDRKEPDDHE